MIGASIGLPHFEDDPLDVTQPAENGVVVSDHRRVPIPCVQVQVECCFTCGSAGFNYAAVAPSGQRVREIELLPDTRAGWFAGFDGWKSGALAEEEVAELADRLAELPADTDIVAYCRGAFCVMAPDAARDAGRRVKRLDGGTLEWALAGLPVDRPGATADLR